VVTPKPDELKAALAVAQKAALLGAKAIALGYWDRDLTVRHKGPIDLVTQYDLESERVIRANIQKAFPEHEFLAEEEGLTAKEALGPKWYVDPLDGTTNYVHQNPFFAVSIALAVPNPSGLMEPVVGVIHAPILREVFWAAKGLGAFRQTLGDDYAPLATSPVIPLTVSPASTLVEALVNTGFPYDVHQRVQEIVSPFARILGQVQAVRRGGAASLDLAFVAAGRSEGYFETGLKPWDVAAGVIIVQEAGGAISDYAGETYQLEKSRDILASNSRLHSKLVDILNDLTY
jgi:myo-inositol-1(or 4)-monophosphatase